MLNISTWTTTILTHWWQSPHCDLGSSPEILSVIFQSDVEYIGLDKNNIDSLGAVKIDEYLGDNPPIKCLSFGHNRLNDDFAILISQALKRNTNLKSINLLLNNFSSIGVKALLTCVFDNSSLNDIPESNHLLEMLSIFYASKGTNGRLLNCMNRLLKINQTILPREYLFSSSYLY